MKYSKNPMFYGKLNPGLRPNRLRFGESRWIGFLHNNKNGTAVLRGETSRKTISGFYVNHRWGFFSVQLRYRELKI